MLTNLSTATFSDQEEKVKNSRNNKMATSRGSPLGSFEDLRWTNYIRSREAGSRDHEANLSSRLVPLQSNSINFFLPLEGSMPPLRYLSSNQNNDVINSSPPYLFQSHHQMCPPLWSLFNLYSNWCSNRHLQQMTWKRMENLGEPSDGSYGYKSHFNAEYGSSIGKSIPNFDDSKHRTDHSSHETTFHVDENVSKSSHGLDFPVSDDAEEEKHPARKFKAKLSKPVNWMLPDEERELPSGPTSAMDSFNGTSLAEPLDKMAKPFHPLQEFDPKCRMLFSIHQHHRQPFIGSSVISYPNSLADVKLPMFGASSINRPEFQKYFPAPANDQLGAQPNEDAGSHSPVESTSDETCQRQAIKSSAVKAEPPPRFQCDACQKSYSTFNGLTKHKEFHCSSYIKKQFLCPHCESKSYASLGALKMHIRTHTLPCKCKLCGKAFSRPWLLQGHLRTHTGERPFECTHCSRAFADRSNLRAHLQTHCDVKRYNCQTCRKSFSRMSLLMKHKEGRMCS